MRRRPMWGGVRHRAVRCGTLIFSHIWVHTVRLKYFSFVEGVGIISSRRAGSWRTPCRPARCEKQLTVEDKFGGLIFSFKRISPHEKVGEIHHTPPPGRSL